jgi:hypothetical protein
MSVSGYGVLWKTLALLMITLGPLAWAHVVGPQVTSSISFGYPGQMSTIFSVPAYSVLLLASYVLVCLYALQMSQEPSLKRLPVFLLKADEVDPGSSVGKIYQAGSMLVFFAIPIVCLLVLHYHFWTAKIFCNTSNLEVLNNPSLFPSPLSKCDNFLRFGAKEGAPQYFLWTTPWAYTILAVGVAGAWLGALYLILRRAKHRTQV